MICLYDSNTCLHIRAGSPGKLGVPAVQNDPCLLNFSEIMHRIFSNQEPILVDNFVIWWDLSIHFQHAVFPPGSISVNTENNLKIVLIDAACRVYSVRQTLLFSVSRIFCSAPRTAFYAMAAQTVLQCWSSAASGFHFGWVLWLAKDFPDQTVKETSAGTLVIP